MNAEIEKHLPEIEKLCQRYGVAVLELFGSATGPFFNAATSDYDFIATFAETGLRTGYGWRFLDFARGLEKLLQRPVDGITPDSIKSPRFKAAVDSSRQLIYAAESSRATA